ncbi:MAG: hypothetical protein KC620_05475 [Myxococcales bacterium]|nr:hypothetical protein [Myxococcales bacterium]
MTPPRLVRLRLGLARAQGVLFLGPEFNHGVGAVEPEAVFAAIQHKLTDRSNFEALSLDDRLTLAAQALDEEGLARAMGDALPSFDALRGAATAFQRALTELPWPTVVSTTADDLAAAALADLGQPTRVLVDDADLVARPQPFPGERTLIKLRGDVVLGQPALTRERLHTLPQRAPALFAHLRGLAQRGPVFFHGFAPRDPTLLWLVEALAPLSGTALLAVRFTNALWRKHWQAQGFEVIDAPTAAELEARVQATLPGLDPRRAQPRLAAALQQTGDLVVRLLADAPELAWARQTPAELEALDGESVAPVRAGLDLLAAFGARGLPLPPSPAALAAEVFQRLGDLPAARQALGLAVQGLADMPGDVAALAAVGRTLNRMGDPDRARFYLERALTVGDAADRAAQADGLAWLSRCVLDRIDRLQEAKRDRAVMESVAAFLRAQADRLPLAHLDAGDDEALRWSVYYIDLRLGRLMALASEMAAAKGEVYARQAVELLTRAVELAPFKPDAYKILRPLLTDRRSGVADAKRWMGLVAGAPPAVQRRLGGR